MNKMSVIIDHALHVTVLHAGPCSVSIQNPLCQLQMTRQA